MNVSSSTGTSSPLTRRQFLKNSGLAVVAGTLAAPKAVAQSAVSPGQTLRVGLIGCGGRGTGAAAQALAVDPNVKRVALGDAFRDRLEGSLATLKKQQAVAEKIDVPPERCFVGFDAYSKEDLSPDKYEWDAKPPVSDVAIPGKTRLV